MELNKCTRCGAFFVSNSCVCPNCEPKDSAEIYKLKEFLSENDCPNTMESLAHNTGISVKNLNRFLELKDFSSFAENFDINKKGKFKIEL